MVKVHIVVPHTLILQMFFFKPLFLDLGSSPDWLEMNTCSYGSPLTISF